MKYGVIIAVAIIVGFAGLTAFKGRVAPTPEVFDHVTTLDEAIEAGGASGGAA